MQRQDAVEIAPGQIRWQACGGAAGSDEQVIVAKTAPARETNIFFLRADALNASIDDVDHLRAFRPRRIGQQLFTRQLPNRELLEGRRIDCWMALFRDDSDTLVGSQPARFYCRSQPGYAIADNHDTGTIYILRNTRYVLPAHTITRFYAGSYRPWANQHPPPEEGHMASPRNPAGRNTRL